MINALIFQRYNAWRHDYWRLIYSPFYPHLPTGRPYLWVKSDLLSAFVYAPLKNLSSGHNRRDEKAYRHPPQDKLEKLSLCRKAKCRVHINNPIELVIGHVQMIK